MHRPAKHAALSLIKFTQELYLPVNKLINQ